MTIQFHIDDLKLSHMDQDALDEVVNQLNNVFRTKKELAGTKGDTHKYLGLTIDFSEKGQVIFTMYDYTEDIIGTAPSDMNGTAPDLARSSLYTVDKTSPLLDADADADAAEFFYSMTARLPSAAKSAKPDI